MNPALAHALALLASLGIAVAVLVLVVWLVFRWLDVETFGPPEKNSQFCSPPRKAFTTSLNKTVNGEQNTSEISTEPDPIESYPPRIRIAPSITIEPRLPVIVNPLTNAREPSSEIVS